MPSFGMPAFELIQMPPLWTTAIKIQMPPLTTTAIELNSNVVVPIAGFCMNQMPAFPLPALSFTLRNILEVTLILFYFFKNSVFSYKTPFLLN